MTLRLEPLDPAVGAGQVEVVHRWVVEDRAQFWMMQDRTLDEVREIYRWIADQPTHAAYLLWRDDQPVALFQTYDPRAEEVGDHFEVRDGDLGIHFMAAPARVTEHGFTASVVGFLVGWVFADPAVRRVVAEPDDRNAKAVALLQRVGFELGPAVTLSTKPARLAFWTRESYEASLEQEQEQERDRG